MSLFQATLWPEKRRNSITERERFHSFWVCNVRIVQLYKICSPEKVFFFFLLGIFNLAIQYLIRVSVISGQIRSKVGG